VESLDRKVSPEDISTFRQEGVVCLRAVIPEEWICRLQSALEEHMSSVGAGEAFNQMNVCDDHPAFRDFVTRSPLPEVAAQLMQSSEVHFYFDHLFVKEPGSHSPTPWHRDYPHWDISGENLCSIWVPLDTATIEAGVVEYVRGSHRADGIWGKEAGFTDGDMFPDVSSDRAATTSYIST
jgi:ectoine hydroxylase-related dioxygenase (phytanoyl-CoA dioxygenase family)